MKKIIIVGGGSAAWASAYQILRSESVDEIQVIHSGTVPIIGTGEGATGSLDDIILKGDHKEFLEKTNSTVKLGILFENWQGNGTKFNKYVDAWHYDAIRGGAGKDIDVMYKILDEGIDTDDVSINAFLMKHELHDFEEVRRHTFHFDGKNVGQFFKDRCLASNKVTSIIDTITNVEVINGKIISLHGEKDLYTADFYIDSTGFRRLFASFIDHEFEPYEEWLDINGAVPFLLPQKDQAYTVSRAMKNGWMWEVPKTNNLGAGYNYSTKHISSDEVIAEAQEYLGHDVEPIKVVEYTSGCYKKTAGPNYAFIGLSAGFIEPLEATALHCSIYSAEELIKYFKGEKTLDQYNDYVYEMVTDFRDFTILHYRMATRNDTKFWQDQKKKPIPEKLQEQIKLFENGSLECLYNTTHIYFMFQTSVGFNFIKKPKVFDYDRTIEVPTLEAINRIKEKHNLG
jgi:tryptophan halogenase